jgi:D-alanyl-D-alanine carboxypeptidase
MKKILLFAMLLVTFSCSKKDLSQPIKNNCTLSETINTNYSKSTALKNILDRFAKEGLPGISLAVYSPAEGWWATGSGYAKIENRTLMTPCHLQYLQSTSKTYMAVVILKLHEAGKLNLDAPITTYLPATYSQHIDRASDITVRMLLNHTSGIPDYAMAPGYVSYLLQHPTHHFSSKEFLEFIDGTSLDFEPGSRHEYCNMNYLLLALIADALTGDHAKYMQEQLFTPLGLTNTFYRNQANYLQNDNLVNSYWDRYGNGSIENVSAMQKANVASMVGDDGMAAAPTDVIKFMKAVVESPTLLSANSRQLMQTWVNGKDGKPKYGMGLYYYEHNGVMMYGHGGAGIGSGSGLLYIPSTNTYLFLVTNIGTVTDGPLTEKADQLRKAVLDVLVP